MAMDPKRQAAMGFLSSVNEDAARDYMFRTICEELGFSYVGRDNDLVRHVARITLMQSGRREPIYVEEPEPWNFPSEILRQRLLLLA